MQTVDIRASVRRAAGGVLAGALAFGAAAPCAAQPTLDQVLGDFGVAAADIQRVKNGELVEHSVKATSERELAIAMFFAIANPLLSALSAG